MRVINVNYYVRRVFSLLIITTIKSLSLLLEAAWLGSSQPRVRHNILNAMLLPPLDLVIACLRPVCP